jgi:hypothetical protein
VSGYGQTLPLLFSHFGTPLPVFVVRRRGLLPGNLLPVAPLSDGTKVREGSLLLGKVFVAGPELTWITTAMRERGTLPSRTIFVVNRNIRTRAPAANER